MFGKNLTRLHKAILFSTSLSLLLAAVFISPASASQTSAATALSSAQNMLLNCYNAAKGAEAAGANITVLVGTLNEAGSLLSNAKLAYSKSDFETAQDLAVQSESKLDNFITEAYALRDTAMQQQNTEFLINVVGPLIGAFGVIIAGVAVWIFLKRKYGTDRVSANES
jgi:hypothetical protein